MIDVRSRCISVKPATPALFIIAVWLLLRLARSASRLFAVNSAASRSRRSCSKALSSPAAARRSRRAFVRLEFLVRQDPRLELRCRLRGSRSTLGPARATAATANAMGDAAGAGPQSRHWTQRGPYNAACHS